MQNSFKVGQVVKIQKWGNKPHPITSKTITDINEKGHVTFSGSDTKYYVGMYGKEMMFCALVGNAMFRIK